MIIPSGPLTTDASGLLWDTRDVSAPPVISVIIPCFNAADTLPLQLEALTSQQGAPPFEVIVVDNRSTDDSARIVEAWEPPAGVSLRCVPAAQHQGASYARNVGIRESRAELLMFCDADDVVSSWWICHGVQNFEHEPLWSGTAIHLTDAIMAQPIGVIREAFGDSPEWSPPVRDQDRLTFPVLMGGNFGATKSAILSLGGFDQSLPVQGEDNDLAFRAQRAGVGVPVSKSTRVGCRGKWDTATQARLASQAAQAHALIATRYDSWDDSPFPHWAGELARCAGASVKMAVKPKSRPRDWAGWRIRSAIALGLARGVLRYRLLHRVPPTRIGIGTEPGTPPKENL